MDQAFEAGHLRMVDDALSSPLTIETFAHFRRAFSDFHNQGVDKATADVAHLLKGRDLLDLPPEYVAALDALLPRDRSSTITDLTELIGWIAWDGSELTEQDRADGYRSVDEFFEFLATWRARYRSAFGR